LILKLEESKIKIKKRNKKISIAIPSSVVAKVPHSREKTIIIGQIARAASIYRVDDIYVYKHKPDESKLISLILRYLETPQYLRKKLYKKKPELKYVGILPPLRTPHHPLNQKKEKIRIGDYRECVVIDKKKEYSLTNIGLKKAIKTFGNPPSTGSRATVQIVRTKPELAGKFVGKKDINPYWGYQVHNTNEGLKETVTKNVFDLKIATSKEGAPYNSIEPQIKFKSLESQNILVAFGSSNMGLKEILLEEKTPLSRAFHIVVNTVPSQGTTTIRTEEAITSTLAILNLILT
jgi:predicted SPOUT superfamily RNA methylase MTH1